jgi:peptide/nickel transport system permease protein
VSSRTEHFVATRLPADEGSSSDLGDDPVPADSRGRAVSLDLRRRRERRGRVALWLALAWIGLVIFVAVTADVLPIKPYDRIVAGLESRTPPGSSWSEPFGTDAIGRSTVSRLIYGARQSLIIGVGSVSVAMVIGLVVGATAGYFRGRFDAVVAVVLDALLSLPPLVLMLAVAAVGQRNLTTLIIGLTLITMPIFARLARANTVALARREHVTAARTLGARHSRIIFRELLPELVLRLSSYAFLMLAVVIVVEASLSFLRLGVPPPTPSWGGMVNDARPALETDPYLVFVPAACIVLTVISFTVVGDRARRRFDTRQSAL